ncbi:MAG: hypothetical protein SWY16_00860 [Cyanobacteriota bacterium]|nr:hypothetical protein [Cyanobacteriota bacterium]
MRLELEEELIQLGQGRELVQLERVQLERVQELDLRLLELELKLLGQAQESIQLA